MIQKEQISRQVGFVRSRMTLPMGGVASGRRVNVLRHSHIGVELSQQKYLLSARSFGQHCRSRRNRLVNQPVSAGPITADRSTSHKASENHSAKTTQVHAGKSMPFGLVTTPPDVLCFPYSTIQTTAAHLTEHPMVYLAVRRLALHSMKGEC